MIILFKMIWRWVKGLFKPSQKVNLYNQILDNRAKTSHSIFKTKIEIQDMVRLCPGKRHAWFNSSVGLIRKPLT